MTPMAVFIFFLRILTSMLYLSCFTDSPAITLHRGFPPLIEMFPKIEKRVKIFIVGVTHKDQSLAALPAVAALTLLSQSRDLVRFSNLSGLIPGMPEGEKICGVPLHSKRWADM